MGLTIWEWDRFRILKTIPAHLYPGCFIEVAIVVSDGPDSAH